MIMLINPKGDAIKTQRLCVLKGVIILDISPNGKTKKTKFT